MTAEKKEIKKKKTRVRTKYSKKPLPAVIKMFVKDLYSLLPKKVIENKDNYKDVIESLKENGYDVNKGYIKIGEYFDKGLKVLDGKKRVVILNDLTPTKRIKVIKRTPIKKKMYNTHIKTKNMKRIINEHRQKSNNTKNS